MAVRRPWGLFEVFGVEIELMIADRGTLAVKPIADELMRDVAGSYVCDVDNGAVSWSNELASHVIELKTTEPVPALDELPGLFHANVQEINDLLGRWEAMLLPTGAHPLMDPQTETRVWPHESGEVYRLYDRMFDCRGHGWSNLQSVHLNLPFADDAEFARLHAAVRLVLPIIPALSASSPVLDGRITGFADTRLEVYRHNQERIPSISGKVVPEAVFSEMAYRECILEPIARDIAPHDPNGVLSEKFVNSRGAIARFDRHAIEIRVIDSQECPTGDLAVLGAIVAVLRGLTGDAWIRLEKQMEWDTDRLAGIFLATIRDAEAAVIRDSGYLQAFGMRAAVATAGELWGHIVEELHEPMPEGVAAALGRILDRGTLATRILRRLGPEPRRGDILATYRELAACLAADQLLP